MIKNTKLQKKFKTIGIKTKIIEVESKNFQKKVPLVLKSILLALLIEVEIL